MKTTVSRKCIVERPVIEMIEEIKAKIALLESDQAAFYELSCRTMHENKDKIINLRKEVHDLRMSHLEVMNKDEAIISQAFQNRPIEKSAFIQKSSDVSIEEFDFRVSAAMKRYNFSKYVTLMKERKVEQLKIDLADAQDELLYNMAETEMKTPQLQKIRDLENRVDKLELKGNECEFIQKAYEAIFQRLSDEHIRCNSTLDQIEMDIIRCRAENADLKRTHQEAVALKATTEKEFRKQEQLSHDDRKRRSIEMARMRAVVEKEKTPHEKPEKRLQTIETCVTPHGEISLLEEASKLENGTAVTLCEERIERLREVTGIGDLKGMVAKFEKQLELAEKLIDLINKMEKHIEDLREDCAAKEEQVNLTKHAIADCCSNIKSHQSSDISTMTSSSIRISHKITEKYVDITAILSNTKAGMEHLLEKMTHVRLPNKGITPKPASPEEYMEELFEFIAEKIKVLLEELKDKDVDGFREKMLMEQDLVILQTFELAATLKDQLPVYNDRVKKLELPSDEEMDSDSDNPSFKNRESMKQDSSQYIEMRLKKRSRRRKNRK